jgi:hypothetical protein
MAEVAFLTHFGSGAQREQLPNADKVCGFLEFTSSRGAAMCCMVLRCFATMAFAWLVATPVVAEEDNLPALTYTPWTKFCLSDTCFIGRDGRLNVIGRDGHSNVDCGPVVAAVLIERNGERKRTSHASQGDSELCGTAIECSLNGTFQIILHKKNDLVGTALEALDYPMLGTKDEWLVHGFSFANYLTELGDKAQSDIY